MDPDLIVGVSQEEFAALSRIAKDLLDDEAAEWLEGMSIVDGESQIHRGRFADLFDCLTSFIEKHGIEDEIRAGCVSNDDAVLYASVLSHCLQRHIKVADILNGDVKKFIERVGE